MKCPHCNEEYLELVYQRTGRCSECDAKIDIEEQPMEKKRSKYKKTTTFAPQLNTEKKTEKMPESVLKKMDTENRKKDTVTKVMEPVEIEAPAKKEIAETNSKQTTQETFQEQTIKKEITPAFERGVVVKEEINEADLDADLDALGLGGFDRSAEYDGQKEVNKNQDTPTAPLYNEDQKNNFAENVSKITTAENKEENLTEGYKNVIETGSYVETGPKAHHEPLREMDEENTTEEDSKKLSCAEWLKERKRQNAEKKKEPLETDYKFNFNEDGFYDDTQSMAEAKPDVIGKTLLIKALGAIVAVFLLIAFLVYYA